MNCGHILADKWRYYQARLKELRGDSKNTTIYIDGASIPDKTPEAIVFDELKVRRYCCRKHLLTHVDLIPKN
jgi:DNA-directed RNA polymerase subunit N (RpoN/RPB10)